MRYRLRTLLIMLALGPPVLAGAWWGYAAWKAEQQRRTFLERGAFHTTVGPMPDWIFTSGKSTMPVDDSDDPGDRLGIELPQ